MYAEVRAVVVHRTPQRIRLRIAEKRGQPAYFAALGRALAEHPEIRKVTIKHRTGSVIIWCLDGFELGGGVRIPGLQISEAPARSRPVHQAQRNLAAIDARIRAASGGQVGLATFIIKLFVAVVTGQVLAQLVEWTVEGLVQRAAAQVAMAREAPVSSAALLAAA